MDTTTRIAAGLERAFAGRGFAEPSVADLRDAAGVSLRTLYRHAPSRAAMVRLALEHRHRRYLAHVLPDVAGDTPCTLPAVIERVASWMADEAAHGCLFHAAVAAAPGDERLRELLIRHKRDVAARVARLAHLPGREADITLLLEGLTQSWPLDGEAAVTSAKRFAAVFEERG